MRMPLFFLLVIGLVAPSAYATIIHVPADSTTIQAGLNGAAVGDTVLVADGVWTGSGNVDLDTLGKSLLLASASGDTALCHIDCGGTELEPRRGFLFTSGEDSTTVVRGFTIENGWAATGGAVKCDGGSPKFVGCRLTGNTAAVGAGLYVGDSSTCVVDSCGIIGNFGDGIYLGWATIRVRHSDIGGSQGHGVGTAADWFGPGAMIFDDCRIVDNTGSGIHNASTICELFLNGVTLNDNGGWGLWSYNNDVVGTVADSCVVQRNGLGGLYLHDMVSVIHEVEVSDNRGPGISVFGYGGINFSECTVFDNDGSGIEVNAVESGLAIKRLDPPVYNGIIDCVIHSNGGHGVYVQPLNFFQAVTGCTVWGNADTGIELAVSHQSESPPFTIAGNTVVFNGSGLILDALSHPRVSIESNILAYNGGFGLTVIATDTVSTTGNDVYGNTVGATFIESGIVHETVGDFTANPLFADPGLGDFTLAENSPCLPGNHPDGYDAGQIGSQPEGAPPVSYAPDLIELSPNGFARVHAGSQINLQFVLRDALGDTVPDEGAAPTITVSPGPGSIDLPTLVDPETWVWQTTYTAGATAGADTIVAHDQECAAQPYDTLRVDVTETAIITSVADIPLDQGLQVRVIWDRDLHDEPGDPTPIAQYVVWRRVDEYKGGTVTTEPDLAITELRRDDDESPLLWSVRSVLWEPVGPAVPAMLWETYANTVPTLGDSNVAGMIESVFQVSAHTSDPQVFFISAPDSGWSVDNLAPAMPLAFSVHYAGGNTDLAWLPAGDEDVDAYHVYRGDDEAFSPSSETLVHVTTELLWVDDLVDPWGQFYKVAAVDDAGNASEPAVPSTVTSADPPTVFTALHGCRPNPFNPYTEVRYTLARAGHASLTIYDVEGRVVRTLFADEQPAGDGSATWDGRDDSGRNLPSGLYVCRLVYGGGVAAMKMSLVR